MMPRKPTTFDGVMSMLNLARMTPEIRIQVDVDMRGVAGAPRCQWPGCHHLTAGPTYCVPHHIYGANYEHIRDKVMALQGVAQATKNVADNVAQRGGLGVLSDVLTMLMKRPGRGAP